MRTEISVNQASLEAAFRTSFKTVFDFVIVYDSQPIPVLRAYDTQAKGRKDIAIYFHVEAPTAISQPYQQQGTNGYEEWQQFSAQIRVTAVSDETTGIDTLTLATQAQMAATSMGFNEVMRVKGVGVQQSKQITTLYQKNDQDDFYPECSFVLTVTFYQKLATLTKTIKGADLNSFPL